MLAWREFSDSKSSCLAGTKTSSMPRTFVKKKTKSCGGACWGAEAGESGAPLTGQSNLLTAFRGAERLSHTHTHTQVRHCYSSLTIHLPNHVSELSMSVFRHSHQPLLARAMCFCVPSSGSPSASAALQGLESHELLMRQERLTTANHDFG